MRPYDRIREYGTDHIERFKPLGIEMIGVSDKFMFGVQDTQVIRGAIIKQNQS
jgi:hypothetical protein